MVQITCSLLVLDQQSERFPFRRVKHNVSPVGGVAARPLIRPLSVRYPSFRGFETVTYMLKGTVEHEDFCGHR